MNTLFIGGHWDGRWMPDTEHPYYKVFVPRPIGSAACYKPIPQANQEQLYRREHLQTGDKNWVLYVWEGITIEEALGGLVQGYAPEKL